MSEPYRIVYSPQALEDLKDIYAYISEELQVPDTARNQVNRIREKIRSLDFMPMHICYCRLGAMEKHENA